MAKKKQKEPFGVIMLYKLGGSEKYHGIECTSDVFDDEDMAKEALAGEWFESPQEAAASAKAAEKKKAPAKKPAAPKSALSDQAKKPERAHNEDGTFKADDPATPENEAFKSDEK